MDAQSSQAAHGSCRVRVLSEMSNSAFALVFDMEVECLPLEYHIPSLGVPYHFGLRNLRP